MNIHALTFERLLDWVEGRLSEQDAGQVAAQVAQADDETRATVAWLRDFQAVSARVTLSDPPANVRETMLRRFREHEQVKERQQPSLFRRLIAQLTFDSGWSLATAGVRAVNGLGNQRQIVCSTDAADVVLNTQPAKGGSTLDVLGQVMLTGEMPEDVTNVHVDDHFVVQLLRDEVEVGMTRADDMGEFTFQAVPPGTYGFVVSSARLEIETPTIELKLA